jgi:uncharacterized protein YggE
MKALAALTAVLLTALVARADIAVSGEAKLTVVPDIAHVSVGVVTDGKTAADALAANNTAMRALFKALEALGISERDIQTSSFTITPKYETPVSVPEHPLPPVLVGYTVSNQITVTVRKVEKTGKVVDALVTDGANRVNGIGFGIGDTSKLMDEVRKLAVADARHRAELYAEAAGVSVGRVIQISENGVSFPPPRMYSKEELAAAGVPLARGELTVSANVTVVYAIGGQK